MEPHGGHGISRKMIISLKIVVQITVNSRLGQKNLKPGPWDKDGRREIYIKAGLTEEKHHKLKKICDDQK